MAVSCAVGSVAVLSTDVVGTTIDLATGFDPIALILFGVGRSEAVDTVGRASLQKSYGFAVSTTSRAAYTSISNDAVGNAESEGATRGDACFIEVDTTPALTGALDVNAMTLAGGGAQLIVDDQFAASRRVGYIAFGGTTLTNAAIVQFAQPGVAGNYDTTTVGFQGDILFLLGGGFGDAPQTGELSVSFGCAKSATEQWTHNTQSDNGSANMDTASYCLSAECCSGLNATNPSAGTAENRNAFVSWLSNGFRLNCVERNNPMRLHALVIKGGVWDVGNLLTQTDTVTTFGPSLPTQTTKGVLLVSACRGESTADTPTIHSEMSIGAFTSTSSRLAMGHLDEDGVAISEVQTAIEYDACYVNVSNAAAVEGLADVQNMGSGFTLIMDDADPAQSFLGYVAVGDPPPAPPPATDSLVRRTMRSDFESRTGARQFA